MKKTSRGNKGVEKLRLYPIKTQKINNLPSAAILTSPAKKKKKNVNLETANIAVENMQSRRNKLYKKCFFEEGRFHETVP